MKRLIIFMLLVFSVNIFAFEEGWVFQVQANVGGSSTIPSISKDDLNKLGASYMKGMTGFVNSGEVQVGYIFDIDRISKNNIEYREITNITYRKSKSSNSEKADNMENDYEEVVTVDRVEVVKKRSKVLSGVGVFGMLGVGQGYAGQISGAHVELSGGESVDADVFFNVYYTPVVSFGAVGKLYFLQNRLAVGIGLGGRLIADMTPNYEFYSTIPDVLPLEVGTIIVSDWMIKNMNPLMFNAKASVEYNQPILDRMELILGGFVGCDIFKPKYITMPEKLAKLSTDVYGFDPQEQLKSFYLNSLNYGVIIGLGFKI